MEEEEDEDEEEEASSVWVGLPWQLKRRADLSSVIILRRSLLTPGRFNGTSSLRKLQSSPRRNPVSPIDGVHNFLSAEVIIKTRNIQNGGR